MSSDWLYSDCLYYATLTDAKIHFDERFASNLHTTQIEQVAHVQKPWSSPTFTWIRLPKMKAFEPFTCYLASRETQCSFQPRQRVTTLRTATQQNFITFGTASANASLPPSNTLSCYVPVDIHTKTCLCDLSLHLIFSTLPLAWMVVRVRSSIGQNLVTDKSVGFKQAPRSFIRGTCLRCCEHVLSSQGVRGSK